MKKIHFILLGCFCALTLTSCFKDEAPNAECDIVRAWLHTDDPTEMFYQATDTMVNVLYTATDIKFTVRRKADITALAPEFELTEGATIVPASGSVQDFSQGPVRYTVTSQDKSWTRDYLVSFNPVTVTQSSELQFNFEDMHLDDKGKYYVWCEQMGGGVTEDIWSTGNAGFGLTSSKAAPEDYPSAPLSDGYDGKAVRLVTRSTGAFGAMVNMRLAAGNLFLGEFDISQALKDARKATRFGLPFDMKPLTFQGYYRYKAGEKFQSADGNEVVGKRDQASVYAILYLNHDADGNAVTLNGDDVQTHPLIVAKAIVPELPETDQWTEFKVDFTYVKDFDLDILDQRGYNLAVVFSSSMDGAYFQGAVGSTLDIDQVRLICETVE